MSGQPRRCPKCLNAMPLARRRCPYCQSLLPVGEETRSLEAIYVQEQLSGRFEIIAEIHRKRLSCLFQAQDLLLDRKVAIKTLRLPDDINDELLTRWEQNAKRAIRLDHPNIVRHFTCGSAGPLSYFISEFFDGETLDNYVKKQKRLPVWEALRIVRDITRAIHAAHDLGLCHHRLKLTNITYPSDGLSRIMDFGSAHDLIDALAGKPWNSTANLHEFLAPEQIESGISDTFSDQYTLGIILYVLLTGRHPFPDETENGALQKLAGQLPNISDESVQIPDELEQIVYKTLAVNPADRFEDCRSFVESLESLDPELWTPHYGLSSGENGTFGQFLSEAHKAEKSKEYQKAILLAEQAMVLVPYDTTVTDLLARLRKSLESANDVRSLINKGIAAFYEQRLDTAVTVLNRARQTDKDNPEIMRIIHEVLQEQERQRLVKVLLEAANIDVAQNALTQAMAKIVKILDIDPGNQKVRELKDKIESAMEDKASLSILYSQAEDAFCEDRIEDAEELLVKICKIDPAHQEAKRLLSAVLDLKHAQKVVMLRTTLEESLKNENYQKAEEIVVYITRLDARLGNELKAKIQEIKDSREGKTISTPDIPKVDPTDISEPTPTPISPPSLDTDSMVEPAPEETPPVESIPSEPEPLVPVPEESPPQDSIKIEAEKTPDTHENDYSLLPESRPASHKYRLFGIAGIVFIAVLIWAVTRNSSPPEKPETISPVATLVPAIPTTSVLKATAIPTRQPISTATQITLPTITPKPIDPISGLLSEAAVFEKKGLYGEAQKKYNEVLNIDKSNITALTGAARCQRLESRKTTPAVKTPKATPVPAQKTTPVPVVTYIPLTTPHEMPVVVIEETSPVVVPATVIPVETPQSTDSLKITEISMNPNPPVRKKALKISVVFDSRSSSNVAGCWVHFRYAGDSGYMQRSGQKSRNEYKIEISAEQINTKTIEYYISAVDKSGQEISFGSPLSPFKITPVEEIFVPVNPL